MSKFWDRPLQFPAAQISNRALLRMQWRRYTRARHVKLPGAKIHRPGYCFASVMVWTENKNVTISDRFVCYFWHWNNQRLWRPVFWGRRLEKGRQLFWGKKTASGDLAWGFSDLKMTWLLAFAPDDLLHDLVTWKWPGCLDVLATPLLTHSVSPPLTAMGLLFFKLNNVAFHHTVEANEKIKQVGLN